jgi:hypothetical protein
MPVLNEIQKGTDIGYSQRGKYIYLACSLCGKPRWVTVIRSKKPYFKNLCIEYGCQQKVRAIKEHKSDALYWNGKDKLVVGMKVSAVDLIRLGYNFREDYRAMLVWHECPDCKTQYWRENRKQSALCEGCVRIKNGKDNVKEKSGRWTGGRHANKKTGYVSIQLQPNDPLYCMARKGGRIFEHKYIYAHFLGRPLEKWEVIHHKGTKYPVGSFEDKGDNRLENLEYCVNQANHTIYNMMSGEINSLRNRVAILEAEVVALRIQLASV